MCFLFPFGLFLHVVPALWDEVTIWVRCVGFARPTVVVGAAPFLLMDGLRTSVRLLFAPCPYRSVSWWSSLRTRVCGYPWLSPVLFPVPCYGYLSASTTLAPGLRLSLVPCPRSFRMGLEPLSEAPLSALQPPAHSSWWSSLWLRVFGS